jgi:hypothetical protein
LCIQVGSTTAQHINRVMVGGVTVQNAGLLFNGGAGLHNRQGGRSEPWSQGPSSLRACLKMSSGHCQGHKQGGHGAPQ